MKIFIFVLILIQLIFVASIDIKTHKISNYWSLVNVVLAVIFYLILKDIYVWSWEVLLFPVGFIVFGFIFFLMGIMGAGDSKYISSLFLTLPLEMHLEFFEKLLLSTVLVGAITLLVKVIPNFSKLKTYLLTRYWKGIKEIIRSRISYAPVILLAWIVLGVGQWF